MRKTIFQRIGSGLLSLLMLSTLAVSPALAADSKSEPAAVHTQAAAGEKTREEMIVNTSAVLLQNGKTRAEPFKQNANSVDVQVKLDDSVLVSGTAEEDIPTAAVQGTPKAGDTSVTVTLGGKIPSGSVLILRSYDADATTFETSGGAWAATQANAEAKAYVLSTKEDAMVAGRKLVALVLSSGTVIAQSQPVAIKAAGESGVKTPEDILKNTTATLMKNGTARTENFKQSEKSVDVKVTLDSSLNQCYMTIFAYSSDTTFDPDSSYNKRLWTGYVKNGQTVT